MLTFPNRTVVAIGEAMIELAPVDGGLYRKGFAGDTFNTAWHMAQVLGTRAKVGFVSRVGQDTLSNAFVAELTADGVDTSGISRDAARTMGLYLIELNGVERSFHYWRGMSAAKGLADDPKVLAAALQGAGLIHLSGITLAILSPAARTVLFDALARARADGALVSFDPNIRARLWTDQAEIHETVGQMLRLTDIALPSFDDEAAHWSDASPQATLARFAAAGVAEVVVKNGSGATVYQADGQGAVATPAVDGIKDTTGAGDAFNAGYLAARLSGQSVPAAIGLGQKLSAEVICTFGARADKDRVRAMAGLLA
ncbi:MAG: sugar kinase [Pseudomonadota bacterium]